MTLHRPVLHCCNHGQDYPVFFSEPFYLIMIAISTENNKLNTQNNINFSFKFKRNLSKITSRSVWSLKGKRYLLFIEMVQCKVLLLHLELIFSKKKFAFFKVKFQKNCISPSL